MSERSSHSGEEKSYFPAKIIRSISICFLCQKGGEPASSVYMITPELHLQQEKIKLSNHLKCCIDHVATIHCTVTIFQNQLFVHIWHKSANNGWIISKWSNLNSRVKVIQYSLSDTIDWQQHYNPNIVIHMSTMAIICKMTSSVLVLVRLFAFFLLECGNITSKKALVYCCICNVFITFSAHSHVHCCAVSIVACIHGALDDLRRQVTRGPAHLC